ncbi:PilX N-terminal domain-containing pilus assembly protein [Thalassotalea maritima]|uniref:pilus assembly PilX family protein n=1 Tax=Thalassotalea maritima TaxID=3242416 RepID=UPI0035297BA2
MVSIHKQRGLATLTISIILLVLITIVSLYLARTVLQEQKLVASDTRAKQAFEAAEAGLAIAQQYFMKGIANNTADGKYEIFASGAGVGDDSFRGSLGENRFSVTIEEMEIDSMLALRITSTGTSSDGTASRTLVNEVKALNPIPNVPDNPLNSKGAFVIGGSATVSNSEGHSSIWSGGDIDVGSNNSTKTLIADPNDPAYPGCMDIPHSCALIESSNREMAGLDIIEHDSDLANLTTEEMFMNFFGMSPSSYKETMATRIVDTANPSESRGDCGNTWAGCVDMALNEVIWIEGDVSETGASVGCAVSLTGSHVCSDADELPSIVIVNGDVDFSGTPHFYGVLFVMGDMIGAGNLTIHGAMMVAGNVSTGTGSLDAVYNSQLLEKVQQIGPRAGVAGAWRDF